MGKVVIVFLCMIFFTQRVSAGTDWPYNSIKAQTRLNKPKVLSGYMSNKEQYRSIRTLKRKDPYYLYYRRDIIDPQNTYIDYLPLSGGSLTGTLIGTNASFTGNLGVGTTNATTQVEISSVTPGFSLTPSNYSGNYKTQLGTQSGAQGILILGNNGENEIRFGNTAIGGACSIYVNNTQSYTSASDGILATHFASNGNIGVGTMSPVTKFSIGDYFGSRLPYIDGISNTFGVTGITVGSSNISNTSIGGGIDLTNNTFSENSYSPVVSFSSRSSNGNYNNTYAAVYGSLAGQGADANWVRGNLIFATSGGAGVSEKMRIDYTGNVGIGTTTPTEKLSVNGNIKARKLIVTQTGWSDYVFEEGYKLRSLRELQIFIKENKHLPEVPTATEVTAKGISLGDNQALLLKKIEELTLYLIEIKEELNVTNDKVRVQAQQIRDLQKK